MNKNYKKALINELFDQNILNSEADRDEIKDIIEVEEENLTGEFEEDVEYLKEIWEDTQEEEEEPQEQTIDEIVDGLKVGPNYVPGLGFGYAKDEEDLRRMKDFVRGGLMVKKMVETFIGSGLEG